jgi:transposase-like protein
MENPSRDQKHSFWRAQVAASEARQGSLSAFCRERGIEAHALNYWRAKLRAEGATPKSRTLPAFIEAVVEREPAMARSLPDPRWLAEVLLHLASGGAR